MTSKWKSCICKGPQRRAWNWRFSWETWPEGNVTLSRPTDPLDTAEDTCSMQDSRLWFLYANVPLIWVYLPPFSPFVTFNRVTMDLLDQEDHQGREWAHSCWSLSVLLGFLSWESHIWRDLQGEAGVPGQPGTEGARGDRGIQVGGVIGHPRRLLAFLRSCSKIAQYSNI